MDIFSKIWMEPQYVKALEKDFQLKKPREVNEVE
jgi:hypothetical protein